MPLHITLTDSVRAAIYGYLRLMAKIHNLSNDALPIDWLPSIDEESSFPGDADHESRLFRLSVHIGNNRALQVVVFITVTKVYSSETSDIWVAETASVAVGEDAPAKLCYFASFDVKTGEIDLLQVGEYKYDWVTA